MSQKKLTIALVLIIIVLSGTTIYFASKASQSQLTPSQDTSKKQDTIRQKANPPLTSEEGSIKTYRNEKDGYEFKYPSFLTLGISEPQALYFMTKSCESGEFCLPTRSIRVSISDKENNLTLDQYYNNWKKTCPNLKKFKIFPLPENYNENEYIEAIRCEFPEVPKQSSGGYTYTIFKGDKIFNLTSFQDDTTIIGSVDGSLINIAKDSYDPLLDIMMRTFRFIE